MNETDLKSRIREKIEQIQDYLENLFEFKPETMEEYEKDIKSKLACERLFEKIIEAIVDTAFFIIREKKYVYPEDDEGTFDILFKKGIISEELSKKLKDAKGMRNIITHKYGEIDDTKVFYAITEDLKKDVEEFFRNIESIL